MVILSLLLAAAAPNPDVFLERHALLALDARCRLLTPGAHAALAAGARQAGAALRQAGMRQDDVANLAARARTASDELDCAAPQVREAAAAAESAFKAWAAQPFAEFPGRERGWSARRRPDLQGWVLKQAAGAARFGVREGADGVPKLTALAPPGAAWSSAALWLRDAERGGVLRANLRALVAPSRAGALTYLAHTRSADPEGGVAFELPIEAARRIAALRPEEAVEIEFARAGAGEPLRVLIEVGDFASALAFLEAGGLALEGDRR